MPGGSNQQVTADVQDGGNIIRDLLAGSQRSASVHLCPVLYALALVYYGDSFFWMKRVRNIFFCRNIEKVFFNIFTLGLIVYAETTKKFFLFLTYV